MLIRSVLAFALISLAPTAMAQTPDASSESAPATVRVPLSGHNGAPLSGLAVFTEGPQGVLIRLRVNDLPVQARGQWHAVHLHETADCSGRGFTASGSHINPDSVAHGLLNPMGPAPADLPNIWADAAGNIHAELYATGITVTDAPGRVSLLDSDGSAIVIHAGPDDHHSQPIGGAGTRIACGAIAVE
ncbi:MAG: superoxide dismutase family protein [Pseudomonadota bacterium]|nr:superoxide dismutase family protein [Pseudomonadota bacterium]